MNLPPLILASASPRRSELLRSCGLAFSINPGHTEELQTACLTPAELCQINAYRKARAIAKKHPDALVLGADTLVALGSRIYGKPVSVGEAERMLQELSGRAHDVYTGVCLLHLRAHRQRLFVEHSAVQFRTLDLEGIRGYFTKVNPLDKAGAYAIQEHGEELVASVEGSFSNVVGLPMERLTDELARW